MAFELANIPYHFDSAYASAIGHMTAEAETGKQLLCPSHLLHLNHQGKPLWYNGSLYRLKRVQKAHRIWMNPVVWAPDTGAWAGTNCMLNVEEDGGPQSLSDGGWDQVYNSSVSLAKQLNAQYDMLII